MANLRSVQKAFEKVGVPAEIVSRPEELRRADRVVLPGVGAFRDAIATLNGGGWVPAIKEFIGTGKPFLGICLGLQLLMEVGYEDGEHRGMGVLAGECVRFTVDQPPLNLKVPHMGWNALRWSAEIPLLKGLPQESYVYFVHGYHVRPRDGSILTCTADYGGPFVAAICKENIMATQFHPEKSQAVGSVILNNFATL